MALKLKRLRIPLEVSEDLHREFKAAAAIKAEKMSDVLIKFVKAYCGRNREELDRLIEMYRNKGQK